MSLTDKNISSVVAASYFVVDKMFDDKFLLIFSLLIISTQSSIPTVVEFPTSEGVKGVPVTKACYVTEFGAWPGKTDSTLGIQAAIDYCSQQGCVSGECVGVVVLSRVGDNNRYMSGPLYLQSNVVLVLLEGVELQAWGMTEWSWPTLYRRVEGIMRMGTASLVNAGICKEVEFIPGVVGDQCKKWGEVEYVGVLGSQGAVIDGAGDSGWMDVEKLTRPTLLNLGHAKNVVLGHVSLINSAFWTVHVPFSQYVDIHHLNITSLARNNDGVDPDSSNNIVIRDSVIDSGDDCIAIKSGKDEDGMAVNVPTYNVDVFNMTFLRGHGVSIGSETSGGVHNITFSNYACSGTDRCIRVKSRKGRGSYVENIVYKNIVMDNVDIGISINQFYNLTNDQPATGPSPQFSQFTLHNITGSAATAGEVLCVDDKPCTHLQFNNINIEAEERFKCANAFGTVSNVSPQLCVSEEK